MTIRVDKEYTQGRYSLSMETLPTFTITLVSIITLICLIHSKFVMKKVPQSVPWAGLRSEIFSKTRACIREFSAGLHTLRIGYNQVCNPFHSHWR